MTCCKGFERNKRIIIMFQNIQLYQTTFLSSILFIGVYFFHLNINFLEILLTFSTVIILDFFLRNNFNNSSRILFPYSGVNAAFWICFFLRTDDSILYVFAWVLAILWKHFIAHGWRHFLNPSNMAVFLTLFLFPQYTWVNTLQWWNYSGSFGWTYLIMLFFVVSLGIYITTRVRKVLKYEYLFTYIIPFLALHIILFFTVPYYESISSFFLFFNISFFIFTFFMITDPKTIPGTTAWRIFFATMIVQWFYVLQFFINETYSILGSLFFSTIFLPIIWIYEKNIIWKTNLGVILLSILNIILSFVIALLVSIYWQPDLVFDNICNQWFFFFIYCACYRFRYNFW